MATASSVPVLVIEDDEGTRHTLRWALEDEGYQVLEAPDGVHGLALLRTHPGPLVVLLDWKMPGMDGVEVLRAVAADTSLVQHHVYILMTASAELSTVLALPVPTDLAVTVFGKPFDLDDLFFTVAAAATSLTEAVRVHVLKQPD
jgi:CheY-like chemotaxis protein